MSGRTWLAAHYPIAADKTSNDPIECTDHAILKWRGLLPSNLRRRKVVLKDCEVRDMDGSLVLVFGCGSCAFCIHWPDCDGCPTDRASDGGGCIPAYGMLSRTDDPRPMLRLLRETRRKLLAEAEA